MTTKLNILESLQNKKTGMQTPTGAKTAVRTAGTDQLDLDERSYGGSPNMTMHSNLNASQRKELNEINLKEG